MDTHLLLRTIVLLCAIGASSTAGTTETHFGKALSEPKSTHSGLICNDFVQISLDASCSTALSPDQALEGTVNAPDDYLVQLDRTLPLGNGPWEPALLTASDIGHTYAFRVTHTPSGNICWGNIKVEDKLPPKLVCQNFSAPCSTPDLSPAYLANVKGIAAAQPSASDCQAVTWAYVDTEHPQNCASGLSLRIERRWTATDASGNSATCTQWINLVRPQLADLSLPPDYDDFDEPSFACGAAYPTPQWIETQGKQGFPHFAGYATACNINWEYHDLTIRICDGTYKIRRQWTLLDWCSGQILTHDQTIKVQDAQSPTMSCPANTTVSTTPFQCCASAELPSLILSDACSRVNHISAMIVVRSQSGDTLNMVAQDGQLTDFPNNNWWNPDTLAVFGTTTCLPIGNHTVSYTAQDDCGNTRRCTFSLAVRDLIPPVVACDETTTVALTENGQAIVNASSFDDGSYDNCCLQSVAARRMQSTNFSSTVTFNCSDVGKTIGVVFRATDCNSNTNECMVQVEVQDKIKPSCLAPANVTVNCEAFDPSLWAYGKAEVDDNCCLDDDRAYQGQIGLTHAVSYAQFDTVCNKGTIVRTFRAWDCHGQSSQCTQRIVVTYNQDYFVRFPDDALVTACNSTGRYGEPSFVGEDCELLGVTYEDQIFTVVPGACFKIERTWTLINWCTYNPNLPCIVVPNPEPHALPLHPSNRPGPTVSACGTLAPWASSSFKLLPGDPSPTNFCTFWQKEANCYQYKQFINIIDGVDPLLDHCPQDTVICDQTANDPGLWHNMDWWDNALQTHDLCEGPSDHSIIARDACSGVNVSAHYLLFLDLDNDGVMETVVNSLNPPPPGIVYFGNALTPNYAGGTPRSFDDRGYPDNQRYRFTLLQRFNQNASKQIFSLRWNTVLHPDIYVQPALPYGTHLIKWFVQDGCGNEAICEYKFTIRDCKPPTVTCINGVSINIMPTGMITLWANDCLLNLSDNCTPTNQITIGVRKCGTGTGFPLDANGNPQTSVTFQCTELGTQCVELWAMDAAGNADYCATYVVVQDNWANCGAPPFVNGKINTATNEGIEEATVTVSGSSASLPHFSYSSLSFSDGAYSVKGMPALSDLTIEPWKNDNPLNGVTTYDLVLISKHILGTEPFDSPYKMIAADANKSGSITTFDIVELRKLILGIYDELPNNTSWRFVDKDFEFPNVNNPFQTTFPENKSVVDFQGFISQQDFVGVKVGDVNNTAIPNATMTSDERSAGVALFDVRRPTPGPALEEREVRAGEEFEVVFAAAEELAGFQFTLTLNGLKAVGVVETDNVSASNFNLTQADAVAVSVNGAQSFSLRFRAEKTGLLSEMMAVSGTITRAEAYPLNPSTPQPLNKKGIALRFSPNTIAGLGFELYQNQPNPFAHKTSIGFHLPEAAEATLTVFDETGRIVYMQKGSFPKGDNAILLDRSLINSTGLLYYKLESGTESAVRKMLRVR
jgi:hypothetical protein